MVLKDHNIASSDGVKEPTALVHVVDSAYLTITILPHHSNILATGTCFSLL